MLLIQHHSIHDIPAGDVYRPRDDSYLVESTYYENLPAASTLVLNDDTTLGQRASFGTSAYPFDISPTLPSGMSSSPSSSHPSVVIRLPSELKLSIINFKRETLTSTTTNELLSRTMSTLMSASQVQTTDLEKLACVDIVMGESFVHRHDDTDDLSRPPRRSYDVEWREMLRLEEEKERTGVCLICYEESSDIVKTSCCYPNGVFCKSCLVYYIRDYIKTRRLLHCPGCRGPCGVSISGFTIINTHTAIKSNIRIMSFSNNISLTSLRSFSRH